MLITAPQTVIGSGVVFNVEAFFKELTQLESQGVSRVHERIHVSSRCHLNFALHAVVDGLSESEKTLAKNQIGTTKRGIGPAYSTKAARDGLRIIDIYHESFEPRLRSLADNYRKRYGESLTSLYSVEDEIQKFKGYKEQLRPYIVDAVVFMKEKRSILVESSQALMLDLDFGSYPFVTSSHCSLGK